MHLPPKPEIAKAATETKQACQLLEKVLKLNEKYKSLLTHNHRAELQAIVELLKINEKHLWEQMEKTED